MSAKKSYIINITVSPQELFKMWAVLFLKMDAYMESMGYFHCIPAIQPHISSPQDLYILKYDYKGISLFRGQRRESNVTERAM